MAKIQRNTNKSRNRRKKIKGRVEALRQRNQEKNHYSKLFAGHKVIIEYPDGHTPDPVRYNQIESFFTAESFLRAIKPGILLGEAVILDETQVNEKQL